MVDTCHVTGTLIAPDGSPLPRVAALFHRLPERAFVAGDSTGMPHVVRQVTSETGAVSVHLVPGAYMVRPQGASYPAFRIDVPDEPSATLADIQDDILQPPPSEILQAVTDARSARDQAEGYRDGAQVARNEAQTAETGAVNAWNSAYNLYSDLQAIDTALNQSLALYGGLSEVQDAVTEAEGSAAAAAASLQAAQEITGGAYGIGTRPMELPRNTELASGAFAPHEPLSLYPITPAAAHILTPDDAGKVVWSGAHDITLPDSAAPGMQPGWRVWIKNTDGVSSITIDCGGASDTLDGNASLSLAAGESVLIVMIASGEFGSL